METNKHIIEGTALDTKANALLKAAYEYWQEYQKTVGPAAVVWVEADNGHFILFTRSEYKEHILRDVRGYQHEPILFNAFGTRSVTTNKPLRRNKNVSDEEGKT